MYMYTCTYLRMYVRMYVYIDIYTYVHGVCLSYLYIYTYVVYVCPERFTNIYPAPQALAEAKITGLEALRL